MIHYLQALRIKEIIGKLGFFVVGILFAAPPIDCVTLIKSIQFVLVCLANGIAVYLVNAGLGYDHDRDNNRLKDIKIFSRHFLLIAGFTLIVIALFFVYYLFPQLIVPAIFIYVIWIGYSLPKGLKGIPLMGILCGFAAQIFHFHLGYLLFKEASLHSLLISMYFGFLFAGGHALHEVIDYEADRASGVNTSAVYFGQRMTFKISILIFLLAAIHLIVVCVIGEMPWLWIVPFEIAFIVQMFYWHQLSIDDNAVTRFTYRKKYMATYLFATALVAMMIYAESLREIIW